MAKNDNIIDFLGDVADAIREKKGTAEPIAAQNFSSEIASIKTDGMRYFDVRGFDIGPWSMAGTWYKVYSEGEWFIGPSLACAAGFPDGIIGAITIDNRKMSDSVNGGFAFVIDYTKTIFGIDFETAFPEITEEEFYDLTWEAPELPVG